jgi:methylenetetrahydrofolate--tRNA-(uracil-5-)-methyltransferase
MLPKVETFAHQTGNLAEMVCSNSFRSDDEQNAVGLHWEMRAAGGIIMTTADKHEHPQVVHWPLIVNSLQKRLQLTAHP